MKKLLTLVLAGVAVKYFLDSEKGSQTRTKLKGWLDEAQDGFTRMVDQGSKKATQASQHLNTSTTNTNR